MYDKVDCKMLVKLTPGQDLVTTLVTNFLSSTCRFGSKKLRFIGKTYYYLVWSGNKINDLLSYFLFSVLYTWYYKREFSSRRFCFLSQQGKWKWFHLTSIFGIWMKLSWVEMCQKEEKKNPIPLPFYFGRKKLKE